ncbi:MAG: CCA tRNA nucleotidyltransferase, partial [Deltaproteobacteria bacterium]|nr:CCA tRNA nucleotidyltransferase [Deltaproteobacteria bacterium]
MPPADAHPALADTLREGALAVARTLRDAGFQAVFAGGCVRDKVLGKAPADYDIATDARPDDVLGLFDKCIPVGVQFGVVRVLLMGHEYEVATFRAEASYEDGR